MPFALRERARWEGMGGQTGVGRSSDNFYDAYCLRLRFVVVSSGLS